MDRCKEQLDVLQSVEITESTGNGDILSEEILQRVSPSNQSSVREGLQKLGVPKVRAPLDVLICRTSK
jgi:hypothetical protein